MQETNSNNRLLSGVALEQDGNSIARKIMFSCSGLLKRKFFSGVSDMEIATLAILEQGLTDWDVSTADGFAHQQFFWMIFRFRLQALASHCRKLNPSVWIKSFSKEARIRLYLNGEGCGNDGYVGFDGWNTAPKFSKDMPDVVQQELTDVWSILCNQPISATERKFLWPKVTWSSDRRVAIIELPKIFLFSN